MTDSDATANDVAENAANGTVVGVTALASDADATNNTILYTLDDDAGGRFGIDSSTGIVTVADGTLLDYESAISHSVTIRASSVDGSFSTSLMTINLLPINDNDPIVSSDGGGPSAALMLFENDLYVTTVIATDADLPSETLTYSIIGGDDAGKFEIDGVTGVLSFVSAPDFESPVDVGADNVYDVTVQVSDGSYSDSQSIAVTIADVNDDGQFLDLFSSVSYTNSDGTETWGAGWVESEGGDPSAGSIRITRDALRFSASNVSDNIYRQVDLSTATAAQFDFTFDNKLSATDTVLVQVSGDGGGNYTTLATMDASTNTGVGTMSLDVSSYMASDTRIRFIVSSATGGNFVYFDDVQISYTPNIVPTITSDGAGDAASVNVAENTTLVTTVTAVDADVPGQTLTYSIVGGADASKFVINSSTGELAFVTSPDYESPSDVGTDGVFDVTVEVSDGIATDTQSIAVTIADVDEFDVAP